MVINQKSISLYSEIMTEIKTRIITTEIMIDRSSEFASMILKEFCFLQFRMIGELIALGSLVAHGDVKPELVSRLKKVWEGDKILHHLEEIELDFFPQPVEISTQSSLTVETVDNGAITRTDLISLIRQAGSVLHRGNLKNLLKPNNNPPYRVSELKTIIQSLRNLLNVHLISLVDGRFIVVSLHLENPYIQARVLITDKG